MKKYLVLLSNHNVIGRIDLTGVKRNWFKTVKPGCSLSFEKRTAGFCFGGQARHTVIKKMLFSSVFPPKQSLTSLFPIPSPPS